MRTNLRAVMYSNLPRVRLTNNAIATTYSLLLQAVIRWLSGPPTLTALLGYEYLESEVSQARLWRWVAKNGK